MDKSEKKRLDKSLNEHWPHTRFRLHEDPKRHTYELSWVGRHPGISEVKDTLDMANLFGPNLITSLKWAKSADIAMTL